MIDRPQHYLRPVMSLGHAGHEDGSAFPSCQALCNQLSFHCLKIKLLLAR
ncbi:hypothetical protein [Paracoccus acridae]|nr:hypothetical protein [Paracoccus acridae]